MKALFLILFSITAIVACKEKEDDPTSSLTVTVINFPDSIPQSGAQVYLYHNWPDWHEQKNAVQSGATDANGRVTFSGLRPKFYSVFATTLSEDNTGGYDPNMSITLTPGHNEMTTVVE